MDGLSIRQRLKIVQTGTAAVLWLNAQQVVLINTAQVIIT